jgi:DNA polymerase III alpha subunit
MPEKFVPLHVHSDHSILDATAKIDAMVAKAKEFGFPALALTDHGNMSGAVHLWDSCRKAGIKPIVGCELYVAPGDHRDKHVPRGARRYHHLVALAANETGYRNLIKLVSLGFLEGLYGGKPRVSMDLLAGHSEGILASTACIAGLVPQALLGEEDPDAAVKAGRAALDRLLVVFGDRLYLELQDHGIPEQRRINPLLVRLSKESGVPLIFTNDSHFVGDEDFEPHRWFLAIQAGRGQTVATKEYVYTPGHKFRSGAEMRALAKAYPKELRPALLEAVERTVEVADRVDFSFQTGTYFLPQVETGGVSTAEFFRRECLAGLERRRPRLRPDRGLEYFRRLCYEMSVVHEMGFEGYFLIVADLIRWAKSHGVPCGPGRGSAAGSLAAYCLGITEIDPLRFDLLFERFLNPERVSMPDVDMDFSKEGRQRVIEYTVERYGRENVAQIVAFGTLAAKAALKDMARAAGLSVADAVKLAGVVPPALDATLPSTLRDKPDECAKLLANPEFAKVWEIATKLEGTTRNLTVHAAGVVIAPEPVDRYVPLYVQGRKGEALVTTQFDKKDVEKVGLVKMDYLGIKTLDQIEECRRLVGGEPLDLDALPVDDRATMDLFAAGDTKGIFQFESEGMRAALRRLRPERFEHLVAMNALFRPGPMQCLAGSTMIARRRYSTDKGLGWSYFFQSIEDLYKQFHAWKARGRCDRKGLRVMSADLDMGLLFSNGILDVVKAGKKQVFKLSVKTVMTANTEMSIDATAEHRFLTLEGWRELKDLKAGDYIAIQNRKAGNVERAASRKLIYGQRNFKNLCFYNYQYRCVFCDWSNGSLDVHHINGSRCTDNDPNNLCFLCPNHHREFTEGKITQDELLLARENCRLPFSQEIRYVPISSITPGDVVETYDIAVRGPHHNFIADGFIVHNSGMLDAFIRRKNGDEPVEALHAEVADLLADTYGVVVYQEQVMRVFQTLGGLSLGEADVLRKAIGKKDAELMRKELDKFVTGGKERGHDEAELVAIAETIRKFAGYGFNKSHAVAYAFLAWQTAWLKAHHPVEFMTALLTTEAKDGKPDKVQEYIGDAKKMGIRIFPPDVNYSEPYFSIERDSATDAAVGIRFGLVGIRNVGEDVVDLVVAERAKRPFGSYPDFLWRIKPNAKVAESFVFAGATGSLGGHPAQHWATTEKILCGSRRAAMAPGQVSLLSTGDLDDVLARDLEEAEPWDETALAANEHEVLGLWLEHHPLNPYRDRVKDEIAALRGAVREGGGRRRCEVLCCVTGVEYREIRNGRRAGQRFAVVGVEDLSGSAKFVMFGPEALDAAFHALIPGTIVVAKGNVSLKNDEATFYVSSLERLLDERIEEPEADSGAEDGDAWDESAETLAS